MISFSRIKNKRPFFVSRIQRKEVGHTDTDTDTIVSALGERGGRHAVALTSPVFLVVPVYRQKTFWQIGKGRDGREQKEENNWEYTHGVLYVCNDIVVGKEREGNTKTCKEEEKRSRRPRPGFSLHHVSFHQLLFVLCVYVCVRLEVIFIRHSGSDGRGSSTDTNVCCRDTTHAGQTEEKGDSHTAIGYYLYSGSTQFIVHTQKEIESAVGRDNMRGPVLTGAGYRHLAR